jgi:ATP-binding cassette subfamily B protein
LAHWLNGGWAFVFGGDSLRAEAPKAVIGPPAGDGWLKRVLPVVFAHKWVFGLSLLLSFLSLLLQVQIPNLLGRAINLADSANHHGLDGYAGWIAVLAVMCGALTYGSRLCLLRTAYDMEYDLRNIIYEHLSTLTFGFYDRAQSGQLISRANSDIRAVQMYLTFGPSIAVQCSVVVVAFIEMLSMNVPLAIVAMITMPLVYWVGTYMRKVLFPVSWLIQARLADVASIVDENINGVRVVKSFAAEQSQLDDLGRAAERVKWAYTEDADIRARWAPSIENLPRVGLAFVLLLGGYMAIHGGTSVGTIVAFNSYVLMLQPPFRQLGMMLMMGQRAAASARRIYEVIDTKPDINDKSDAMVLGSAALGAVEDAEEVDEVDGRVRGDIRFDHVSFAYAAVEETDDVIPDASKAKPGPLVLDDFTFHMAPGETVALVGPTGCGKSTVARLLERFYDVQGGAITVDGLDVRDVTQHSLREQIGMAADDPFLFSVSIHDNIAYGKPDATREEVVRAAKAANAHRFIEELPEGYETVIGERGYTLSGGQRQRISIARTLLVNPPVLVLDDATSAIDVRVEQEIYQQLRAKMENRTTLVIAHRMSTISLADRVVLLDEGKVIADGTHAELSASVPRYLEILAQAAREEETEAAR